MSATRIPTPIGRLTPEAWWRRRIAAQLEAALLVPEAAAPGATRRLELELAVLVAQGAAAVAEA